MRYKTGVAATCDSKSDWFLQIRAEMDEHTKTGQPVLVSFENLVVLEDEILHEGSAGHAAYPPR